MYPAAAFPAVNISNPDEACPRLRAPNKTAKNICQYVQLMVLLKGVLSSSQIISNDMSRYIPSACFLLYNFLLYQTPKSIRTRTPRRTIRERYIAKILEILRMRRLYELPAFRHRQDIYYTCDQIPTLRHNLYRDV